jgi:tellurite resistance protein TerC
MESIGNGWLWAIFGVVVLGMLAVDLWVAGGGREHKVSVREAGIWTLVWVGLSLAFAGFLWFYLDGQAGREVANARTLEFLTGYLIEKALAVDNVFVWMLVFSFFGVAPSLQKRVLTYGVLGAILMRAAMVFGGAWLISQFAWILYVFGAFLVFTGVHMLVAGEKEPDLGANPLVGWLRRHLPLTPDFHGERFVVRVEQGGRLVRMATPLLLALILVEISDVVFAVDSIPAIFAVTLDPFIVLTSNIFAILGLRSMYFLLAGSADRFPFLKYGLALVLVFIGSKMLIAPWFHLPIGLSLLIVAGLLGGSLVLPQLLRRFVPGRDQTEG